MPAFAEACSLLCAESEASNTASSLDEESLDVSFSGALNGGDSSLRGLNEGFSSLRGLNPSF
jgi:hypothetical protein